MNNIQTSVKGNKLTIEVDLSAAGEPSSSGKTILVANSEGAQTIPGAPKGFKLSMFVRKPLPESSEKKEAA